MRWISGAALSASRSAVASKCRRVRCDFLSAWMRSIARETSRSRSSLSASWRSPAARSSSGFTRGVYTRARSSMAPPSHRTPRGCGGRPDRITLPRSMADSPDRDAVLAEISALSQRLGELNDRLEVLDQLEGISDLEFEDVTTIMAREAARAGHDEPVATVV